MLSGDRLNTTEKFWPDNVDERVNFGDSMVRKLNEQDVPEVPGLIERRLEILAGGEVNWHVISQYHFTRWSGRSLNKMAKPLLNFCHSVKSDLKRSKRACIVHCNDSVSRTGSFIGLMNLLSDLENGKEEIDIFGTVFKMRTERMKMVLILKKN